MSVGEAAEEESAGRREAMSKFVAESGSRASMFMVRQFKVDVVDIFGELVGGVEREVEGVRGEERKGRYGVVGTGEGGDGPLCERNLGAKDCVLIGGVICTAFYDKSSSGDRLLCSFLSTTRVKSLVYMMIPSCSCGKIFHRDYSSGKLGVDDFMRNSKSSGICFFFICHGIFRDKWLGMSR